MDTSQISKGDSLPAVTIGNRGYAWDDIPVDDVHERAWAHPGITSGLDGTLYLTDASGSHLVTISPGNAIARVPIDTTECHGLALDPRGGIWIVDNGQKAVPHGANYKAVTNGGRTARFAFSGEILQVLECPDGLPWSPTSVAVHNDGNDADARVWVADGYGRGLVHCFTQYGKLLWTSDGRESGTPFVTPHAIIVDTRSTPPRLLVADRGNHRVVALSLDGKILGTFGQEELTSPSGFAINGNHLLVTELYGRLAVFDRTDALTGTVGNILEERPAGWPNSIVEGITSRPPVVHGTFRSPHGITTTAKGDIIITEWFIGGRITRLSPTTTETDPA
ncbi:hypothetical protein [Pseudarthrobacter sp. SSS035]|uniref:hypothetical protein n=1 Tax=Pseudarthrobacter sp. SSS035 TaxID=2931399 RepID=UPI00200DB639|nr:hypothetical protein [Pseudarthrobacter sp. SSS035]